jgi:hypothetical protein
MMGLLGRSPMGPLGNLLNMSGLPEPQNAPGESFEETYRRLADAESQGPRRSEFDLNFTKDNQDDLGSDEPPTTDKEE